MRSYTDIGQYEIDINHQRWPTGDEAHKYFDETCERCLAAREFRKAVAHLVDKDRIVSEVLKGYAYRLDLPVPPFQSAYYADLEGLGLIYEYSRAMAVSTLEAAGFSDWDDDGTIEWKSEAGVVEELPELVFYIRMDDPNRKAAGEMLAAELKAIGIPVNAIVTERTVCYKQVMVLYNFHLYTGGWSLTPTPDTYFDLYTNTTYYGPDVGNSQNYNGFCNNEFYEYALMSKYPSSVEEAKNATKEAGRVFAENVGAIPMYARAAVKVYKTGWEGVVNMEGFGIDDNPYSGLRMYNPADDTIDYAFKSDIEQLNSISSSWLWDSLYLDAIYSTMMDYNPFNLDFTEHWLAESHEIGTWINPETGENATELIFTLRSGVTWHDGDPFTAEDVKFTIEFMIACGAGIAWQHPNVIDVYGVDIVEALKVRVRMKSVSVWAIRNIGGLPIVKKAIWENIQDAAGKTWTDPGFDFMAVFVYDPMVDDADENDVADLKQDGTGPWIFDEYVLGTYISAHANTNFYLSQDYIDDRVEEMFSAEGDVDRDEAVGTKDIGLLLRSFATTPATGGTPGAWGAWNPAADLDEDDEVTLKDLTTAGKNYGRLIG